MQCVVSVLHSMDVTMDTAYFGAEAERVPAKKKKTRASEKDIFVV